MDKPIESDALTSSLTPRASVSFDTIPDKDPLEGEGERVSQQGLLPGSVQARNVGSIVTNSAAGLGAGTYVYATIPATQSLNFLFTLADNQNRVTLAVPDVGFFVNGAVTEDNRWPTSTLGMGTMPVLVYNDWGLTDNINTVTHVVWRNNSGDAQPVVVVCRWRIITNTSAVQGQGTATPAASGGVSTTIYGSGGSHL